MMTGVDTAVHASEAGGASPLPTGTVETGESSSPAVAGSFSEALAAQADDGRPSSFSGFAPDTSEKVNEDLGEATSESEASLTDSLALAPEVVPETKTSDVTPPITAPPEVIPEATTGKTGESLPTTADRAIKTVLAAPTIVEDAGDPGPQGQQPRGSAKPSGSQPVGHPSQPPGTAQPAANVAAGQSIPVAATAPQTVRVSGPVQDSGTPPAPDAATVSVASEATPSNRSEQGAGTTIRSSANPVAWPEPGPQPSHSIETTGPSAADVATATTSNAGPTGVSVTGAPPQRAERA